MAIPDDFDACFDVSHYVGKSADWTIGVGPDARLGLGRPRYVRLDLGKGTAAVMLDLDANDAVALAGALATAAAELIA